MRSSKQKAATKSSTKKVFTSAPVVFILVLLLGLFLIDVYRVVNAPPKQHDTQHHKHKDINSDVLKNK